MSDHDPTNDRPKMPSDPDEFLSNVARENEEIELIGIESQEILRHYVSELVKAAQSKGANVPIEIASLVDSQSPLDSTTIVDPIDSILLETLEDMAWNIDEIKSLREEEKLKPDLKTEFEKGVEDNKTALLEHIITGSDESDWKIWLEAIEDVLGEPIVPGKTEEEKQQFFKDFYDKWLRETNNGLGKLGDNEGNFLEGDKLRSVIEEAESKVIADQSDRFNLSISVEKLLSENLGYTEDIHFVSHPLVSFFENCKNAGINPIDILDSTKDFNDDKAAIPASMLTLAVAQMAKHYHISEDKARTEIEKVVQAIGSLS